MEETWQLEAYQEHLCGFNEKNLKKYIHTAKEKSSGNLGSDLHDLNLRHMLGRHLEEKMDEMDTWKRHMDTSKPINKTM